MTKDVNKYVATIETNDNVPNVYHKIIVANNEAVAVINAICQCKLGLEKVVKVEKLD